LYAFNSFNHIDALQSWTLSERYFIGESIGSNQKYLNNVPNHNNDEIVIATKTLAEPKSFAKPDSG
tara:strand:- start:8 stop:205 length:198 start_codon:yes stop_codon:yes gene_type:complete